MEDEMQEKENDYQRLEMKTEFYRNFWLTKDAQGKDDKETEADEVDETTALEVEKYVKQIELLEAKMADLTKKNKELNLISNEMTKKAEERKNNNIDMLTELNKVKAENLTLIEEKKTLKNINCMIELESECQCHDINKATKTQTKDEEPMTQQQDNGYKKTKTYRTYECRYGSKCTRADCWFDHPTREEVAEQNKKERRQSRDKDNEKKKSKKEYRRTSSDKSKEEEEKEKAKGWLGIENCEFARDEVEMEDETHHNGNNQLSDNNRSDNKSTMQQDQRKQNDGIKRFNSKDKDKEDKEKLDLTKPKVVALCWHGKKCWRQNCKFDHGERTENKQKPPRNDDHPRNDRSNSEKKNPPKEETESSRRNKKHDYSRTDGNRQEKRNSREKTKSRGDNTRREETTNPFLEETVAQIADMMIDLIQQKMGDVRPLKRNPDNVRRY